MAGNHALAGSWACCWASCWVCTNCSAWREPTIPGVRKRFFGELQLVSHRGGKHEATPFGRSRACWWPRSCCWWRRSWWFGEFAAAGGEESAAAAAAGLACLPGTLAALSVSYCFRGPRLAPLSLGLGMALRLGLPLALAVIGEISRRPPSRRGLSILRCCVLPRYTYGRDVSLLAAGDPKSRWPEEWFSPAEEMVG